VSPQATKLYSNTYSILVDASALPVDAAFVAFNAFTIRNQCQTKTTMQYLGDAHERLVLEDRAIQEVVDRSLLGTHFRI